jgi:hypothetical protein
VKVVGRRMRHASKSALPHGADFVMGRILFELSAPLSRRSDRPWIGRVPMVLGRNTPTRLIERPWLCGDLTPHSTPRAQRHRQSDRSARCSRTAAAPSRLALRAGGHAAAAPPSGVIN